MALRSFSGVLISALITLLPAATLACPSNSIWLGDTLSGGEKTRHCQCFPGFVPKGDTICSPNTSGTDARRLPEKSMRLVTEAFGLGLPGIALTEKALRERIARADPFEPEAQQALSFVDGVEFMERVKQDWGNKQGRPTDPSKLAATWQKVMYDEDNSVFGPQKEDKPQWLHWMLVSRTELVEKALEESKYDLTKSETYLRERLEQPPPGPRMNAYRFLQGMLLYMSSR